MSLIHKVLICIGVSMCVLITKVGYLSIKVGYLSIKVSYMIPYDEYIHHFLFWCFHLKISKVI